MWRKAHALTLDVYATTGDFPAKERFGLTNQMRRAAISVASNIAEGCGRDSDPDTRRLLQMAMGSAAELHAQLLLARDLKFLPEHQARQIEAELEEVKRMPSGLIARIGRRL